MTNLLDIFKALADEGRLRILRALHQAELSVAELVAALEMPQSTVSRHLKPMRETGLVESRREGTSMFYDRGPLFRDESFSTIMNDRLKEVPAAHQDAAAVDRVLELRRKRSRDFFDAVAGRYGSLTEPGGGWQALAAGLAAGFTNKTVADLGCGEGALTLLLARFAKKVVAFDQSQRMLKLVEEKAMEQGLSERVELSRCILEKLDLEEQSFDAIFLSQALHHTSTPNRVIKESAKALRPNGQLIILDLMRHEHEWTREQWADQWLGFDPRELKIWAEEAQLTITTMNTLPGATPDLAVLMMAGIKNSQ